MNVNEFRAALIEAFGGAGPSGNVNEFYESLVAAVTANTGTAPTWASITGKPVMVSANAVVAVAALTGSSTAANIVTALQTA